MHEIKLKSTDHIRNQEITLKITFQKEIIEINRKSGNFT